MIPYQTTVHTLSLILGGIGSAQENMQRYLDHRNLLAALEDLYRPGDILDFLAAGNRIIPWSADQSRFDFVRGTDYCRYASLLTGIGGLAFLAPEDRAISLSNGRLVLRYRSEGQGADAQLSFKRARDDPLPAPTIPVEIFTRFKATKEKEEEMEIVLPATPALRGIREVSLTFGGTGTPKAIALSITGFVFIPFDVALEPVR